MLLKAVKYYARYETNYLGDDEGVGYIVDLHKANNQLYAGSKYPQCIKSGVVLFWTKSKNTPFALNWYASLEQGLEPQTRMLLRPTYQ